MLILLIAIIGSFSIGAIITALILYRFSKLPEKQVLHEREALSEVERTRNVVPIEMEPLIRDEKQPKGIAAFEEKTRQVNIVEFADLLHLDHEEIVAEPVPDNSEEQLAIAREDSRQLQSVIEKSGPLGQATPQVMIQVISPSRYVFSSRNRSCGLPN